MARSVSCNARLRAQTSQAHRLEQGWQGAESAGVELENHALELAQASRPRGPLGRQPPAIILQGIAAAGISTDGGKHGIMGIRKSSC